MRRGSIGRRQGGDRSRFFLDDSAGLRTDIAWRFYGRAREEHGESP
jgi:hypothetical protein